LSIWTESVRGSMPAGFRSLLERAQERRPDHSRPILFEAPDHFGCGGENGREDGIEVRGPRVDQRQPRAHYIVGGDDGFVSKVKEAFEE
jgi:hypothetical protein